MTNSKTARFEGLKELADGREAQAARSLAESLGALRAKEAQLQQLRDYLDEYQRDRANDTFDAARWENTRRFVSSLSDAVTRRETELEAARARYQSEAERWRDAHRQTKAFEKLVDKYYREELKEIERRDQKELDEQTSRLKRSTPTER